MQNKLSRILTEKYGLSEEAINQALASKTIKGDSMGDVLVRKNLLSELQYLEALGLFYHIPFQPNLVLENLDTTFTQKVPIQFLRKYQMVPLAMALTPDDKTQLLPERKIAVTEPIHFHALDDLVQIMRWDDYTLTLSTKTAIASAINMAFDLGRDSAEELVQNMEENEGIVIDEFQSTADLLDDTSDAPIIKLVNHIISQSTKARASDIHIEPYQDSFKVRYRVDGILYDLLAPPKRIQAALTSRIKVMAKMNIAEKRLPQDGRIDVKIGNQEIDIRVSTIPTSFGERVVLRLLNKSSSLIGLPELGLSPERLSVLEKLVKSPNGIILVTGPTGSGKTTSLYAILSSLNKPDINIITIEDPVEYRLRGISQIQVNPKIDLTFAKGLRSIVRQDPDIILVGEIRDRETAEIAVQSALTGHLVFSTLHTNDSASAITRLVDIDVEPFLIASSVLGVVAQRLIRTLCQFCKEPFTPDDFAIESLGLAPDQAKDAVFYRPKGCPQCVHTGYKGRIGIFEIMVMESNLKSLILRNFDANRIKQEALKNKMVTLREDGLEKIFKGITSMEEVIRVTHL
ncbi:MAG: type II secretion system ATPase GspE [Proteobacteria bacterium]|nr:type II secretion system ATPase GspE [Pseudomonadota bacterium]MBU4469311.1 type II secretion system ATPase GspE [Pseudomonadota bacterium]MCG2750790.1 type II secretion system ATPase GspE [Desulfobacteraceae bacterium]